MMFCAFTLTQTECDFSSGNQSHVEFQYAAYAFQNGSGASNLDTIDFPPLFYLLLKYGIVTGQYPTTCYLAWLFIDLPTPGESISEHLKFLIGCSSGISYLQSRGPHGTPEEQEEFWQENKKK